MSRSRRVRAYQWAPSTEELARRAGLDPVQIVRFDGNVPPLPLPSSRPAAIAAALARINEYAHGGYPRIHAAIADYAGVEPENVVLGAGADDLLLLAARAFAGPGDTVAIPSAPTYPLFRIAAQLAGADVGDADPVLTFCCRPATRRRRSRRSPTRGRSSSTRRTSSTRGEPAVGLIDDGVVVVRTFSKIFALAGARVGYALASPRRRCRAQRAPGAGAGIDALGRARPRGARVSARRPAGDRGARAAAVGAGARGYAPLPSRANFVYVPVDDAARGRRPAARAGLRRARLRRRHPHLRARPRGRRPPARLARRRRRAAAVAGARAPRPVDDRDALRVRLALDGASRVRVSTGAGLYDHFLEQLAFHAGFDLVLEGSGDRETGDHHTAEDAAIALGEALDRALGDRRGHRALRRRRRADGRRACDRGGRRRRPARARDHVDPDPGLARHVLASLAENARIALHVESTGRDAHHVAEAAFKATGRALRAALRRESACSRRRRG